MKGYFCDMCGQPYKNYTESTAEITLKDGKCGVDHHDLCNGCFEKIAKMFPHEEEKPTEDIPLRPKSVKECMKISPDFPCATCDAPQDQCMSTYCGSTAEWSKRHGYREE